jgi:hypothetical protein
VREKSGSRRTSEVRLNAIDVKNPVKTPALNTN